ncbi:MAG: citrate synthase [Phycisphaerae bacterium]
MPQNVISGLEGVPIAESAISRVDGEAGRLEYRGISVEQLAEHSTFEETSWLLLYGALPTMDEFEAFKNDLAAHRHLKYRIVDLIKCLPETGHPMDALQAVAAAIGMFYTERHGMDEPARRLACLRLIAKLPSVVAAFQRLRHGDEHIPPRADLSHAGNFLYMMTGRKPDTVQERILDVSLILHADHTMNASTFAGRVVGSTLADPYCVVSSALGALSGPLHGGANEDVMAMLEDIGAPDRARPHVERMIAEKQKIPGFGHRVYKAMDPRAKVLKTYAEQLAETSGSPMYHIAAEVETVVTEHYGDKGIWPNVDFYSGIVYSELGIPRDCFTPVFAVSRVSGWLAHWLEQLEGNRIFRPTQKFVGKTDQQYVAMMMR